MALTFPNGWNSGSIIGSILQNFQVFVAFRFASGTAYTGCQNASGNEGVRTGDACFRGGFQGGLNTLRLPSFKQFDMRFIKGFSLGRSQLALYLDVRNHLQLYQRADPIRRHPKYYQPGRKADRSSARDSSLYATEARQNGVYLEDGSLDLTFGGAGSSGCASWITLNNEPSVPNCVYLARAEQRWGNGDGVFTQEEQLQASSAFYYTNWAAPTLFYGPGTQLRLGVEFTF